MRVFSELADFGGTSVALVAGHVKRYSLRASAQQAEHPARLYELGEMMQKTNAKLEKVREMQENLTTVPTETREEVRKLKRSIVEFVQQSESQVKDRSARSARVGKRG